MLVMRNFTTLLPLALLLLACALRYAHCSTNESDDDYTNTESSTSKSSKTGNSTVVTEVTESNGKSCISMKQDFAS